MKTKTIILLVFVVSAVLTSAGWADDEAAAIEAVIQRAYVEGIWLEGDEEKARSGFDSSFVMQVGREGKTLSVSIDAWLERLGLKGEALDEGITHEIEVLDQVGGAAVARVRVFQGGEPRYTDYMSLYKSGDEWKIVAKTFHTHR
ncbi:MAG: nuclear transport factor 2 family protein [Thermoanaerobaculia bacterium]